jgi:hypothetical protein
VDSITPFFFLFDGWKLVESSTISSLSDHAVVKAADPLLG